MDLLHLAEQWRQDLQDLRIEPKNIDLQPRDQAILIGIHKREDIPKCILLHLLIHILRRFIHRFSGLPLTISNHRSLLLQRLRVEVLADRDPTFLIIPRILINFRPILPLAFSLKPLPISLRPRPVLYESILKRSVLDKLLGDLVDGRLMEQDLFFCLGLFDGLGFVLADVKIFVEE